MKKFRLLSRIVDYQGHIILTAKLAAVTEPTIGFEKPRFPDTKSKLRIFLWALKVYRPFIRKHFLE